MMRTLSLLTLLFVASSASGCLHTANKSSLHYSVCQFCQIERFTYFIDQNFCPPTTNLLDATDPNDMKGASLSIAAALLSYGEIQGFFWENDAMTQIALAHLILYMPPRDSMRLFSGDDRFLEFLLQHVRYALLVRTKSGASWAKNASGIIKDEMFLDYVLPYAFLDEKRDVNFFWRQRFYQLFNQNVSVTKNITEAMHFLAEAIPRAHAAGVLSFDNEQLSLGASVHWQSETSPMRMSPEQVIMLGGGSCTGTAIVMAAAARSVGIPARVTGCSQSIKDDDHHWIEFYDPTSTSSPFGDHWHTKEGTSSGNEGGPWDAPSSPMNTCLQKLLPKDPARLNTIWASSWSSEIYMPLQWSMMIESQRLAFVGGQNRCGDYCGAWGCGTNQTKKWTQKECDVPDTDTLF